MKRILIAIAIFIAATPTTTFAVDRDDDVKIESEDSIAYQQSSSVASSEIEAKFPHMRGKVLINSIGTTIGSHTEPGTVALFFWGAKRGE